MNRPRFLQKVVTVIMTFLFLMGCSTPTSTPTTASTLTPSPAETLPPTSTPDLALAEKAATLFEQDFESGTTLGIFDDYGDWSISIDEAGNHVLCNNTSKDWQSFKFGSDTWTDYAVEARLEFPEENANQSAEVYARIDSSMDGYRATLAPGWAGLGYYPPAISLGGSSITTQPNAWYTLRVEAAGNKIKFYLDDRLMADGVDNESLKGSAGVGAGPDTRVCVDNLRIWALTPDGRIVSTNPLAKYEGECQFCFLSSEGPSAPVQLTNTYGFTYPSGDTREKITWDETFTVPAGENATFENKIILIKPVQRKDIEVYGTLTIENSVMIWLQTDYGQIHLRVKRGGTLIIKDSYSFWGNSYWVNWDFEDGSTVKFDHFVGDPWTTISGSVHYTAINYSTVKLTLLEITHDTKVQISNAHQVWFEIFPSEGTYTFTLPAKRQWADWNISGLWPNTTVEVRNSYIYERDISLNPNTHVTVQDTPSGFGLGWMIHKASPGYVDCELKDMGQPGTGNENGKLYEDMTWDLPCINSSLTLKNSRLEKVWPYVWGSVHLKVYDSNLADAGNSGTMGTLEIYDSTIDEVFADTGGRIYIENSSISDVLDVRDPNSAVYGFGITGPYELKESAGGVYTKLDKPGSP